MRPHRAAAAVLIAVCATAAIAQSPSDAPSKAPDRTPTTIRQAVSDLASSTAETRRAAVVALAKLGGMPETEPLVRALRDDDPIVRGIAEQALWIVWSRSGDAGIDRLFGEGIQFAESGRMDEAVAVFTRIIEAKPDFAEGWNKRATLYFLMGDLRRSLADCDEVIKRNPSHFGALSGYGQIYMRLNEPERAAEYFERALAVNPNMPGVIASLQALEAARTQKRRNAM